jgi:putative ABC transport system permease protein
VKGVASTSPIRLVPARVGTDRKNLMAIEPGSFQQTATATPRLLAGEGLPALARDRDAVIVASEIADGFSVNPGDTITLTVFPDDPTRTRNLKLHVAGVFRSFPPTEPLSELVMNAAALPGPPPGPDFYLARLAPGNAAPAVADELRLAAPPYTIMTIGQQSLPEQRTLTALNLRSLSRLEAGAAGLVAATGVAVLGAFLVLERRREAAVLRSVGATTAQTLTGPAIEGAVAVLGSLVIGMPVGIGLAVLSIRVLGLFFTLPPPIVVLPSGALLGLAGVMVGASLAALAITLYKVSRQAPAAVLREP